ncbi:MAG TPA: ribonuclease catalytic domain-containing protein, partial [Planctomycetota bacterium]|nr:ribonuclease catalytic domain-containing protein [Planctomycetota bacterium]
PSIAISEPHRRDLTSLDVFSVDDETTTDIDDAFSLERLDSTWRVGIHITDLTRAVPPGSALDREASRRVISHYCPERKIGMLPPPLSDDRGSLVEGEARPALSLLVELDDEGTIVAREWTLSTIKSRYRMSYDKVERVLEAVETNEAEASHPLAPALATLLRFAEKRRQLRVESGAVEIDRADLEIRVREDGEIEVELRKSDTKAQSIVSELMILYNVEAARYASENNIPVLYRAQAKIREEARAESARAPHPALRRSILLRAASPPDWTAEPAPHGFLGVDLYTHASSPLRRYVDLLIQRQIVAHLEHGEPAHDREAVSTILYETEERLRELRYLEANRRQYWLLQYLKRRMDEDFDAVVLENNERFALVELTDLGMRAPANLRS